MSQLRIKRTRTFAIAILIALIVLAVPWGLSNPRVRSKLSLLWDSWVVMATAVDAALLLVGAMLAAIWWFWWRLPKKQVEWLSLKIRDPKDRADVEDNFRKTIGQVLGGAAVLIGAGVAYLQFTQQQQAAGDLLISNQVAKSFEQLAGKETSMRLGGIYGLEGVMNTSERYQGSVLEALCAFVREATASLVGEGPPHPATDIQAALSVIARRNYSEGSVSFENANIRGANLINAQLRSAMLARANLSAGQLRFADLSGASLVGANLAGADLVGAKLAYVTYSGGLRLAGHFDTHDNPLVLLQTSLTSANLTRADLTGADLTLAKLTGADLTDANLTDADLTAANVDQVQLDKACGTGTKLPPGLVLKPCQPNQPVALPLDRD